MLLDRYSRQERVCVGSPYAGRDEAGTEGVVGYFVNTLALAVDVSGDPTVGEFMGGRVRSSVVGAFRHADLPFARVVSGLGVARDASRSPVFQVMFVLQDGEVMEGAGDDGDEIDYTIDAPTNPRSVDVETEGVAKFDLTLALVLLVDAAAEIALHRCNVLSV